MDDVTRLLSLNEDSYPRGANTLLGVYWPVVIEALVVLFGSAK